MTNIKLEHHKYGKGLTVSVHRAVYGNGQNCLRIFENGMPYMTASVSLVNENQADNEVFIKNWSENDGIMQDLMASGIIGPVMQYIPTGFVEATRHVIL